MAVSNATIAQLLRRYSTALTLEGADRFKVKAYRRAAETIESLPSDLAQAVVNGENPEELPGIGKAISAIISEIIDTGTIRRLEKSLQNLKPELVELASFPGLDPKTVRRVYKKLGIANVGDLKERLDQGEIGRVLGSRVEFQIRQGLDERPRMLLWKAGDLADNIEAYLRRLPGVTRVSQAGSLRRKKDTVGDFNFLVAGSTAARIFKEFSQFGAVQSWEKRSKSEATFRLSAGLNVVLHWTAAKNWGRSLILATGSVAHVTALRELMPKVLTSDRGMEDEGKVFRRLGLAFIEPELREGRGEVEAAQRDALPTLVEVGDLKGDLHMHTTASDGVNSIEQMAAAARKKGYRYIGITDHSQSLKITNGLSESRLREHIRAIDKLNSRLEGFVVLKSAEVDILEDGSLDYSNRILKELDFTICSIHSRFALNREQQTERILRAMDNPYFNILGHATGRLLLRREGYGLDMERIMRHARERGCYFEINSSPNRLDLSDENAKRAKEYGIKIAVNTDAHSIHELEFISAGINQARRGWLGPTDVLNTLPVAKLLKLIRR
jgi:DNA polymerase (family 10)